MNRFKKVYQQGTIDVIQILVDTETGVNYVFQKAGYAGGLTPLLEGWKADSDTTAGVIRLVDQGFWLYRNKGLSVYADFGT